MIDCNITANYFAEKKRMTNNCSIQCVDCPIMSATCEKRNDTCRRFEQQFTQEAIAIVQKWSDEHPRKTILMDFLDKYPKAIINENKVPIGVCPHSLGYPPNKLKVEECTSGRYCEDCWNKPLEED